MLKKKKEKKKADTVGKFLADAQLLTRRVCNIVISDIVRDTQQVLIRCAVINKTGVSLKLLQPCKFPAVP